MVKLLAGAGDKIVAGITAFTALISGVGGLGSLLVRPANAPIKPLTAIVSQTVEISSIKPIVPGLLPTIAIAKIKSPRASTKVTAVKPTQTRTSAPTPSTPATTVTAQWLLANATPVFTETRDNPYEVSFAIDVNGKAFTWNLTQTTIGGASGIPPFTAGYACNPPPVIPDSHLSDQNPLFNVDASYSCTVYLTPTSGIDQRTQTKIFNLSFPAGQLMVAPASSINTVLKNEKNDGGIVFNNQDSSPITIQAVALDISFTYLSTIEGPLVLRFADPVTGQPLSDYHLEGLPELSSSTFTYGQTNITVPVNFVIGSSKERSLPIQILNVQKMGIPGTSPAVHITLRGVTTNRSDVKTVLTDPDIIWTCTIPTVAYDPNATSGVFVSGQACTQ